MIQFKKRLTALFLALTMLTPFAFSQSNIIDEVIGVVGDNPILRSDVEFQYQQAMMQGSNFQGDLKCHIFEQLLLQNLLLEQAKLDSIEVSENMVIMQVDRQINEFINRAGSREKLEEWLNKPIHRIKREQRDIVRNQMLTQQMQGTITENVKVTPAEIRAFYRKTPQDSLPMVNSQYEIQQIKVFPNIDTEEVERVKSRLREFQRQVSEGRDFATLAVLYSEDQGSAARGGELGFMSRAELVPEFAQVAFNMQEPGRVSKIVESEFGFHIIQLIERQGDRVNVRHILMRPKAAPSAIAEAQERTDSIARLIREEEVSFEEAALRFSMDKETRINGGLMINPNNQSTKFEIQAIPAGINRQLEKMEVDDVSDAFMLKDERLGKDYFVLIKLKSKTEPHRANLTDDYQLIQTILENQKREDIFHKWIVRKQDETYISLSPNWINCQFEFEGWNK
ncbi:peptidylprolyl isomerase [Geofilum rubicundum]|uniref:Survival protein SurA n=1 Tax=Geofilum rubicundum JCM 15548 TaxID=1236989 RepID=A0A0E9M3S8_9BACT|nr:peptidylprolyl isomerase [Geofilum rubicundum]GAO31850.1 survival protein SurA precursor [Geofilum rubicundum JCM 15548]